MNSKQYKRAARLVLKGVQTEGTLHEPGVGYCMIGELAHAVGIPDFRLANKGTVSDAVALRIYKAFGLDEKRQSVLIEINDSHHCLEKRRAALLAKLEKWLKDDQG